MTLTWSLLELVGIRFEIVTIAAWNFWAFTIPTSPSCSLLKWNNRVSFLSVKWKIRIPGADNILEIRVIITRNISFFLAKYAAATKFKACKCQMGFHLNVVVDGTYLAF